MNNENGNGHGIFTLAPKTDPDTLAMFTARRSARADARLTTSMKACFDEIADRSFNPEFYDAKGIVTISDSVLAEIFGVSNRTIYTWKRRIEECGYAWTSMKFKSNMWPLTTYHLSCLHKQLRQQRTDADGTYGGRKFRQPPANPGLGARQPRQCSLPLPGSRSPAPEPESADLQGISGESGKKLRLSAEANFGSEPKPISGESRNKLRARAEANFGSEPKLISGESRSQLPARAEADFQHRKDKVTGSGTSKGGKGTEAPPADAFEVWDNSLIGRFPSHLEKMREKFRSQVKLASPAGRALLKRKIARLDELLDGPQPEWAEKPVAAGPARLAPKPAPMPLAKARELMAKAKAAEPALARK